VAQQFQDSAMLVAAHRALGTTLFVLGAVATAHTHFTQGIKLYDSQQQRASTFLSIEDVGVICRSQDAWALWCLGYLNQGLARSHEAVTLAQRIAHPYSLGFALNCAAMLHQFCHERRAAQQRAEATISLATEQGFPHWMVQGAILRGWALAQQGQSQEGIEQIHRGLTAWRATGAELARPYWLALLVEAYGIRGHPDQGLEVLEEALTLVDTTGERWYEPELHRLKGELLLQQASDNQTEVESCFHHALESARTQQAKSFELRTATSLARLWHQKGKRQEAHDLLAPVYNWFTEGFDTADLKDAKALLQELEDGR
jgi:predicted ATPase